MSEKIAKGRCLMQYSKDIHNVLSSQKECSDVGKEQDIIRKPHLLQLPRTVSRALGRVIDRSEVDVQAAEQ